MKAVTGAGQAFALHEGLDIGFLKQRLTDTDGSGIGAAEDFTHEPKLKLPGGSDSF